MQNTAMAKRLTMAECCRICGKSRFYIRNLQRALGLPVPDKGADYPIAHVNFLQRVIAMRTFNVPMENITDLLAKEKSLLRLLKADSLGDYAGWYLDQCGNKGNLHRRLLLTGYDVGFSLRAGAVQSHLDFGNREKELFDSREMGENIHRALNDYLKAASDIKDRVLREKPVLKHALKWARANLVD